MLQHLNYELTLIIILYKYVTLDIVFNYSLRQEMSRVSGILWRIKKAKGRTSPNRTLKQFLLKHLVETLLWIYSVTSRIISTVYFLNILKFYLRSTMYISANTCIGLNGTYLSLNSHMYTHMCKFISSVCKYKQAVTLVPSWTKLTTAVWETENPGMQESGSFGVNFQPLECDVTHESLQTANQL